MSVIINGVELSNATLRNLKRMPTDAMLERANELVDGYGVEYIRHKDDTQRREYGLSFVNVGETYTTTLIWDHTRMKLVIGSWGDIVERAPEGRYR